MQPLFGPYLSACRPCYLKNNNHNNNNGDKKLPLLHLTPAVLSAGRLLRQTSEQVLGVKQQTVRTNDRWTTHVPRLQKLPTSGNWKSLNS